MAAFLLDLIRDVKVIQNEIVLFGLRGWISMREDRDFVSLSSVTFFIILVLDITDYINPITNFELFFSTDMYHIDNCISA